MRAVRRHGLRVVAFDTPEKLATAEETFVAVLVAHARGLDELEPTAPVLQVDAADDLERRVGELLAGLA